MPSRLLTVVVSTGQSRNPEKRELEQGVVDAASRLQNIRVLRIPHLYDLSAKSETYQMLQQIGGDLILLSWIYPRAAHWILDRNGVRGQVGQVELREAYDDEEDESEDSEGAQTDELAEERVISAQPRPQREIYAIDFRAATTLEPFVAEITRIAHLGTAAAETPDLSLRLSAETLERFQRPANDTYVGVPPQAEVDSAAVATLFGAASVATIDEHPSRRWYPVIDFSRCTNCMECIDFCLFGVYGIDSLETIMVEQADNCRKGCAACSRVCPQNAIIFPQHKTPAIAGAPVDTSGFKIDLSKLFGAPDEGEDATAAALRERDEQLILAGRPAVGASTGISERLAQGRQSDAQPDQLDDLLDQLDALDL